MGNTFNKLNKKPVYYKFNENKCSICLDKFKKNNTIILDCYHKFHASCIFKSMAAKHFKCPLCRKLIRYKYPKRKRHIFI